MSDKLIEVFLTYKDNFPAGTFYIPKKAVRQLLIEIEDIGLSSFRVEDTVYLKDDIRGIRINGHMGIELPYNQKDMWDDDFSLLDLMDHIHE